MPLPQHVQFRRGLLHCCGESLLAQLQRLAEAALGTPAAAMGVLHHIGAAISRRSYWRETYRVLAAPADLGLLSIIVARHPLMHAEVDALPSDVVLCTAVTAALQACVQCLAPCCGGDCHPCQMKASPTSSSTLCQAERHSAAIPGG
jgi:hypothetical protein